MLQWFRMYSEFATDTKVQSMDETLQRRFVMFLCLHCAGEFERLDDDELAFALRITPDELARTKEVFARKGFLGSDGKIRNWNKRQYQSDSSTERVRKHRDRQRNGDETLQKRPQTQITDTDTDSEKTLTAARVSRGTDDEWFLDFKLAYPNRSGDQGWKAARKAANARMSEGRSPEDFIAGAKRYAAYCEAKGDVGTPYVKKASTFLGSENLFLEAWTPPPSKSDVRQNKNLTASQQWLAEQEANDAPQ